MFFILTLSILIESHHIRREMRTLRILSSRPATCHRSGQRPVQKEGQLRLRLPETKDHSGTGQLPGDAGRDLRPFAASSSRDP